MHLRTILESRVTGTQSIIHGDLNLENILVGPGDLVWLIDFASTREGHTLFDFARLEAEITTQVISEIFIREGYGPESFYKVLDALEVGREPEGDALRDSYRLLNATRQVAGRLLFDTAGGEELDISLYLAYLGTLKFSNLDELPSAPIPKTLAFTAAAYLITKYLNSN
jgi:thiamine kinase-like enzyme